MSELIVILSGAVAGALLWWGLRWRLAPAPARTGPVAPPGHGIALSSAGAASGGKPPEVFHWPELGRFDFAVAATAQYQAALRRLLEQQGAACAARLHAPGQVGEPVEVRVNGVRVGYLHDSDATRFQRRLAYESRPGQLSQCGARIVPCALDGRRTDKPLYTIMLDLKPFRH